MEVGRYEFNVGDVGTSAMGLGVMWLGCRWSSF